MYGNIWVKGERDNSAGTCLLKCTLNCCNVSARADSTAEVAASSSAHIQSQDRVHQHSLRCSAWGNAVSQEWCSRHLRVCDLLPVLISRHFSCPAESPLSSVHSVFVCDFTCPVHFTPLSALSVCLWLYLPCPFHSPFCTQCLSVTLPALSTSLPFLHSVFVCDFTCPVHFTLPVPPSQHQVFLLWTLNKSLYGLPVCVGV